MATQRMGKYEILEELGRGGFATVYRAHDTVLGRDVALKILHPALLADPDFVTRFENDARAAAQLDHPHIVTVHDLGQLEGRLYIAMQLLPGGTLAEHIKREGPLPFEEAVKVVQQMAGALDYAHGRGFVHRDVKPTNVLFNARGEAVVTDFGLVKAAESSILARSTGGGIVGTAAYIAPEVWEEKGAGPGTDVYALGCVLFEMLTGEPIFKGDTSPAVMMAHFQPHEYPAQWPEGVPPEVEELLERALAQDPADRYASAGAFAADLQALAARAADPLAEPYQMLQAALAAEDWEQALGLAQEIAVQDPDYLDVSALRQQAAEAQARAERAQWAAQWREQALAAERAGQLDAARVAAQKWLEMAPGDAEAKALLEQLTGTPLEDPLLEIKVALPSETGSIMEEGTASRTTAEQTGNLEPSVKGGKIPGWVWVVGGGLAVVVVIGVTLALGGRGIPPSEAMPTMTERIVETMSTPRSTSTSASATPTLRAVTMTSVPPTRRPTNTPRPTSTPTPKPTSVPASAILYIEDFEDEVADGWSASVGTWSVKKENGNHFWLGTGTHNYPQAWLDDELTGSIDFRNWTDYAFESRIRFVSGGSVFICVRSYNGGIAFYNVQIDNTNNWVQFAEYDGTERNDGSNYHTFGGVDHSILTNRWYTVRFQVEGDSLRLYIDDELVTASLRFSHEQGGIGYYMEGEVEVHIDDIRVWTLTP